MDNRKLILFDLDGTLTDPGLGITNAIIYALKNWNIEVEDRSTLYPFIGPPLVESFQKFYGFTPEQAQEALLKYREYFSETGLYENEVYEDIPELLETLKSAGFLLGVATSKPEEYSIRILEHFGLLEYFDFISGATMDEKRVKKSEVIAYAIDHFAIDNKDNIIMVGDREHDVIGAHENGLRCIGVLYGYGDEPELLEAGAEFIADTVDDILFIVSRL